MAKSPDVILHIGAHKTATTHLQMALQSARPALSAQGVAFYGPTQLRKDGQFLPERLGLPFAKVQSSVDAKAEWQSMVGDAKRVVLSEENFVGVLNRKGAQLVTPLYSNAVERIAALASVTAPEGIDLFLSIRAPATFLNSAYSQILMAGSQVRPEIFKAKNPLQTVDWVKYINRLTRIQSLRSLTVWPYEDYAAHFLKIVSLMVGSGPAKSVKWESEWAHRSLSARAVAEIMELDQTERSTRKAKLIKSKFPVSESFAQFDVFSGEDHARSGVLYADQIRAIEQMPKVTLLRA